MYINKLRDFWQTYKRNRAGKIGFIILFLLVLIGFLAPIISIYEPLEIGDDTFNTPSYQYPFGTDNLGRDVFSGVLCGLRISLMIGALSAVTAIFFGVLVGSVAGYYGGKIENLLMRLTDIFMVIPRFILILVLVALFGSHLWLIICVIGLLGWTGTARLVRAEFLKIKELPYIEAARVSGANDINLIFSEILPNAIPPIIVNASMRIANGILTEAGLNFFGLGDPTIMSLGFMLQNAQKYVLRGVWWMSFFPGFAIFLTILSLNLVGDGLNDALNPRIRER